jgi:hypothetical protein
MAKVTIVADGVAEVFDFDGRSRPVPEAVALEDAYGAPYGQWEADLAAGSARALAGFIWLVWRRAGRDVDFAGILAGTPEIDVRGFAVEQDGEAEPAGDGA